MYIIPFFILLFFIYFSIVSCVNLNSSIILTLTDQRNLENGEICGENEPGATSGKLNPPVITDGTGM